MKKIVVIGAGGYAKVIAETIDLLDHVQVIGFMDDRIEKGTSVHGQLKVLGSVNEVQSVSEQCDAFIIGIGNNEIRKQIANKYSGTMQFETIIHPRAYVSKTASIQLGTVILAGAVVGSMVKVGVHGIVNANVVIDHDSIVGNFVHLSIGTSVGSNTEIADGIVTLIGQAIPSFSVI